MKSNEVTHRRIRAIVLAVLTVGGLLALAASNAQAHPATGIVVDRKGQVYFSGLETVWKIGTDGRLTVFRAGIRGRHVHELSIDGQDNIYGADISYESSTKKWISDVWRMSPEGKFDYLLPPTSEPPRGVSIWRDGDGNMYFVDQNNHLKQQTLLLRRTPTGAVTTLAGGAYGHVDGKGTQANFGSVGGMAFGTDGNLYMTDGTSVRRVSMNGEVTTLARELNFRTPEDKPTLFGGAYGNLTGLAVDANGNVYVADAGNRRLLKVDRAGKVDVVLRTDPPYFPNGVFVTPSHDLLVLEVGFALPNISSGPRVRKISAAGQNSILASIGSDGNRHGLKAAVWQRVEAVLESLIEFFVAAGAREYTLIALSLAVLGTLGLVWRNRNRQRRRA